MMRYWRIFNFLTVMMGPTRMALKGTEDVFRIMAKGCRMNSTSTS